jgi:hypothetical protein
MAERIRQKTGEEREVFVRGHDDMAKIKHSRCEASAWNAWRKYTHHIGKRASRSCFLKILQEDERTHACLKTLVRLQRQCRTLYVVVYARLLWSSTLEWLLEVEFGRNILVQIFTRKLEHKNLRLLAAA